MDNNVESLTIAVSARALFDFTHDPSYESLKTGGVEAYENYQKTHTMTPYDKGVAYNLLDSFVKLNNVHNTPIKVNIIILSHMTTLTATRVMNTLISWNDNVSRNTNIGVFTGGDSVEPYVQSYSPDLYLTTENTDLTNFKNIPIGIVYENNHKSVENGEKCLKIAFDFDGVIASDESEIIFQHDGLESFNAHEKANIRKPLSAGPLNNLVFKLGKIAEQDRINSRISGSKRLLKLCLITARSLKTGVRAVETLKNMRISFDQMIFTCGSNKNMAIKANQPDMFFDDGKKHVTRALGLTQCVHIPLGVANVQN